MQPFNYTMVCQNIFQLSDGGIIALKRHAQIVFSPIRFLVEPLAVLCLRFGDESEFQSLVDGIGEAIAPLRGRIHSAGIGLAC